ncbi:hypothetical protein GCM10023166_05130 [Paeniglutamicibacter cryotolerans]
MGQGQGPAGGERRVETGERIFGKSQRLLCREAPVEDFYAFIEQQKAFFPITWMCQRLGISRASYYRWSNPTGHPTVPWGEDPGCYPTILRPPFSKSFEGDEGLCHH